MCVVSGFEPEAIVYYAGVVPRPQVLSSYTVIIDFVTSSITSMFTLLETVILNG
jgi:hypothetical protein